MALPVDRVISIELVIMLNDGFEASIWVAALGRGCVKTQNAAPAGIDAVPRFRSRQINEGYRLILAS